MSISLLLTQFGAANSRTVLRKPAMSCNKSSSISRLEQQLSHLSNPSELTATACCAVPASANFKAETSYSPKGKDISIAGFPAYAVGSASSGKAVISIYDIFGFHNNAKQVCDVMAELTNTLVVMPDSMDGAWSINAFPPKNDAERNAMFGHIMKAGSWPKVVKPRLQETVKYLKSQGINSIGVMGFCWGSKMCMNVIGDSAFPDVKGAALFHPSMLENSDAEKALKPAAVFPSKDEPDLTKFVQILKGKYPATIDRRFDDMPHGWVGATANFSDPAQKKQADVVIDLGAGFFNKVL